MTSWDPWTGVWVSPTCPVLGRIKGLDIIQYFPPKAGYFLVVPLEDYRGNIVGSDGAEERSMNQECTRQSTTFERMA